MRVLLFSMLTMVLSSAAAAQNSLQDQHAAPLSTSPQIQDQSSANPQKPLRPTELYAFDVKDPHSCFFIRSYNFERRGTEAPKLKNMTTCTPAKSVQFRQTDKKPQVRLIPAN